MNILPKTPTTLSSRDFNQDTARAKRAAKSGPVFITDRGKRTHVLLTVEEYEFLKAKPMSLREALMDPHGDDFDFDFPEMKDGVFKGFEFD